VGVLREVLASTTDQEVGYRLVLAALGFGQQMGDPFDPSAAVARHNSVDWDLLDPSAAVARHNSVDWAPAALVLHVEVPGVHPEDQAHRVQAELLHLGHQHYSQNA
jgi:hypothetical protein